MIRIVFYAIAVLMTVVPTEMQRRTKAFHGSKFNKIYKRFKSDGISPDGILVPPERLLEVYYRNKTIEIDLGTMVTRDLIMDPPEIVFPKSPWAYYTFICINIDALEVHEEREKNWWPHIIVNIKGTNRRNKSHVSQEILTPYHVPKVPYYKKMTRLMYLIFEQPTNLSYAELRNKNITQNFDVGKFARKYDLEKPLFGNYALIRETFPNTTETYPTPTYSFDYDSSLDEGPNPLWSEWRPRRH